MIWSIDVILDGLSLELRRVSVKLTKTNSLGLTGKNRNSFGLWSFKCNSSLYFHSDLVALFYSRRRLIISFQMSRTLH